MFSKLTSFSSFISASISVICSSLFGAIKFYRVYIVPSRVFTLIRGRLSTSKQSTEQAPWTGKPRVKTQPRGRRIKGPYSIPTTHDFQTESSCPDYIELGETIGGSKRPMREFEIAHVEESVGLGFIRKEVTWDLYSERLSISSNSLEVGSMGSP